MYGSREGADTRQIVSIDTINSANRQATGITRFRSRITINLRFMWGGMLVIPSPGEQWVVEKVLGEFVLIARTDFQDERRLLDLGPGDTVLGQRGKTHLFGDEVVVDSTKGVTSSGVDISRPPFAYLTTDQDIHSGFSSLIGFNGVRTDSLDSSDYGAIILTPGLYEITTNTLVRGKIEIQRSGEILRSTLSSSSLTHLEELEEGDEINIHYEPEGLAEGGQVTASLLVRWISPTTVQ